jgi:hypothetical protein
LVGTAAGFLYGQRWTVGGMSVFRLDPRTNHVTEVASIPSTVDVAHPVRASNLLAAADGHVWLVADVSLDGHESSLRTMLLRLGEAGGFDLLPLSTSVREPRGLAEVDGQLYLSAYDPVTSVITRIDRLTGLVSPVCAFPGATYLSNLSAHRGALYLSAGGRGFERLVRCDPATGGVTARLLPSGMERFAGPLTQVGASLYGASDGRAGVTDDAAAGYLFRLALDGPLPALDADADTLPDEWETAFGLDPHAAGEGSGAADDPDGDGRSNAQELAEGTHPRGLVTTLFAEGAANAFFRTRFDLANPARGASATVRTRFLTDTGAVVATDVVIPPRAHVAIEPAALPGLGPGSFSAVVESDLPIAVDRTMTWGASGYGSHLETGIAAPATTWYFAEGSTSGEFSLFYLLQNPQTSAVTATVRYLRPFGQPPIERRYTLPPASRTTIVVDAQGPELASTDVSAEITATAPIVAERAMYLNRPGQPFAAGHDSAGVTAPALEWFLAEGATGSFFDLFVLLANPSASEAAVDVEFLRTGGPPLTRSYVVRAQSRLTIWVDDVELPAGSGQRPLAHGSVSTTVRVTNGVPVVVERAMWWPGSETTADYWYEAHNAAGSTTTATSWAIGGAAIGGADAARTYVLIANMAERDGTAIVRLLSDDGEITADPIELPAKSRTTVDLGATFPSALPGQHGVLVRSTGLAPVPIVVERATYGSPGGAFWSSGGNALASPLP